MSAEGEVERKVNELVDEVFGICQEVDAEVGLKYNKMYIGLTRGGVAFNFCTMVPRKSAMNLTFKLPKDDSIDQELDAAGLDEAFRVSLPAGTRDAVTRARPVF